MRTIAVMNLKGGVGKTTVTLGLASAAVAAGLRVLVVDADPGAHTSGALLWDQNEPWPATLHQLLNDPPSGPMPDVIARSSWGVGALPAGIQLGNYDLNTSIGAEQRLRLVLGHVAPSADWDLCLIDCPGSVGQLGRAALLAADSVLIVTEPSLMGSNGVADTQAAVEIVRESYARDLVLAGIAMNRMTHENEAVRRDRELREDLPGLVWGEALYKRASVAEAVGAGRPIHEHKFRTRAERDEVLGVLDTWLRRLTS